MSTETIRRKWRAGAELAQQINREFAAERATRPALEVERRLALCRACAYFSGNGCLELQLHADGFQAQGDADPVSPTFAELLTRREFLCRRWSAGYQERRGARGEGRGVTEEGLARLHKQGIRRTADEHRAARREAQARRRNARK